MMPTSLKYFCSVYLQRFDKRVCFWNWDVGPAPKPFAVSGQTDILAGYYSTTDDDGRPLVILWPRAAPAIFDEDPVIMHEINLIRTFVARFTEGQPVGAPHHVPTACDARPGSTNSGITTAVALWRPSLR